MTAGNPKAIDTDVLVCGGGMAGVAAAVAAARGGARVVLMERYGFLGGNATAGAVAQFNSWQTANGRRVVAGVADEVVRRLRQYGGAGEHHTFVMSTGHRMDRVEYAPEILKLALDDIVSDAGVLPLFHASLLDVQCDGRHIATVRALTKSGVLDIRPRVLVDASGDIDALRRAGARFLDLEEGEALQPATLMFRFGPIDAAAFDAVSAEQRNALAKMGHERGELPRAALHSARDPLSGDAWFNIGRLGIDATDAMALGRAEIEGRQQAWRASQFLNSHVPGCANGRLLAFATQVGVRETRRVAGDHVLTADELRRPEPFADAIAAGAYPIDIHPASGGGLHYEELGEDHAYRIPFRSLVPEAFDNALVAGRGISATHAALAAIRVMTISMAVGQAAGSAAAMAALVETPRANVRGVDVGQLRETLLRDGAILA